VNSDVNMSDLWSQMTTLCNRSDKRDRHFLIDLNIDSLTHLIVDVLLSPLGSDVSSKMIGKLHFVDLIDGFLRLSLAIIKNTCVPKDHLLMTTIIM
jgi:hypothetical protein